jgi:peptide/nickel transport system ATP-binding protein
VTEVLKLEDLTVAYRRGPDLRVVVEDLSLSVQAGQILGLVGESGSGKSTTALAMLGFVPSGAKILGGRSILGSVDLIAATPKERRQYWGKRIAYISQNAALSLNPALRISRSLAEPMRVHLGLEGSALSERMERLLESTSLSTTVLDAYPHQLSGGQQQRVALAIALSCEPDVLVLDEPTTGLDVTTQASISRLIKRLVADTNVGALFVSHDIALLDVLASSVAVMYAGEIVERGTAHAVFRTPRHPYSAALVSATPRLDGTRLSTDLPGLPPAEVVTDRCNFSDRCSYAIPACREAPVPLMRIDEGREVRCIRMEELGVLRAPAAPTDAPQPRRSSGTPILEARSLVFSYRRKGEEIVAVNDVSFEVASGERLGIVGESGSGKSTLLRIIAGLRTPSQGQLSYRGEPLPPLARRDRDLLQEIQMVFQNPDSSLNPRQTIASIIGRPLVLFSKDLSSRKRRDAVGELLARVRLDPDLLDRYPDELSGGQKQRVALARAFAARPRLLLCDEVVSALDVSVQASILSLIDELVRQEGATVLFVTHDLGVAANVTDRIMVVENGRVCETGATARILNAPSHPYTKELLGAVPQGTA